MNGCAPPATSGLLDGEICEQDGACKSAWCAKCDGDSEFRCIAPDNREAGEACCTDNQCLLGLGCIENICGGKKKD